MLQEERERGERGSDGRTCSCDGDVVVMVGAVGGECLWRFLMEWNGKV